MLRIHLTPTSVLFMAMLFLLSDIAGQDIQKLKHKYYTSYFSVSKHIPVLVEFVLEKNMVSCPKHSPGHIERTDSFNPDPDLLEETDLQKDYGGHKKDNLERGHNMSAEDNQCDLEGMNECFYFSNMFPQNGSLNKGVWKTLEKREYDLARANNKIKVFIGNYGSQRKIGPDKVVVPKYLWKVIYIPKSNSYECYEFENKAPGDPNPSHYRVTLAFVQKKSGYTFKKEKINPGN
ncbi:MAG: hypothetical protein JWN76_459 [Chitinophagaceae bacterium]|nr:hypothetical protein [Chitinophagaceae bacterium]